MRQSAVIGTWDRCAHEQKQEEEKNREVQKNTRQTDSSQGFIQRMTLKLLRGGSHLINCEALGEMVGLPRTGSKLVCNSLHQSSVLYFRVI